MKIAIHHRPGSFSDRWIDYCIKEGINYVIVNAYDSNIVSMVSDCDIFMWHHHQSDYRDVLFARQLIYSLEMMGIKCFPNFYTTWHFDDKVGQKYLFESLGVELVPSYVFYSKQDALTWLETTDFPKVFKLRGGASAVNVKLAKSKDEAKKLINIAFNKGFQQLTIATIINEGLRKRREGKKSILSILKDVAAYYLKKNTFRKMHAPEVGYVYFQDYIPNNVFDIRVIVIGNKAFAIKRMVRENDFRASGSGNIKYDPQEIPLDCISISFDVSKRMHAQSIALDYVLDDNARPLVVEVSYGFAVHAYDSCPGYWTDDMKWHEEFFIPQEWMLQDIVKSVCNK